MAEGVFQQPEQRQQEVLKLPGETPNTSSYLCIKGGNIANRLDRWQNITSDAWICDTVRSLKIEFIQEEVQQRVPFPYKIDQQEGLAID